MMRRRVGGGVLGDGVFDDVHALVWRVEGRGDGAARVQREPREREDEEKRGAELGCHRVGVSLSQPEEDEDWDFQTSEREE